MKRTNVNSRYAREKQIFTEMLHMTPVPFSGSRKELGKEDAYDACRLGQAKSTVSNAIAVKYIDLYQLRQHAQGKAPLLVVDFCEPTISTPESGRVTLPADVWAMVPVEVLQEWFEAWVRWAESDAGKMSLRL